MFFEPGSSLPNDAAPQADRRDYWLDEALRTVPLPTGFLERVAGLADAAEAKSCDRADGLAGRRFAPTGWRRA